VYTVIGKGKAKRKVKQAVDKATASEEAQTHGSVDVPTAESGRRLQTPEGSQEAQTHGSVDIARAKPRRRVKAS